MGRTTGFGHTRLETSLELGRRNAWSWLAFLLLVVVGCSSDSVNGSADRENIRTSQQRLTSDQLRVLDFESPSSDWSASQGSLGQVGPLTSGSAAVRLAPKRIALWDTQTGSMPSGWTRFLLERFEFPYTIVCGAGFDDSALRSKYDVIIMPSGASFRAGGGGRGGGGGEGPPAGTPAAQPSDPDLRSLC